MASHVSDANTYISILGVFPRATTKRPDLLRGRSSQDRPIMAVIRETARGLRSVRNAFEQEPTEFWFPRAMLEVPRRS
jgi:hypothetical protein